MAITVTEIGDRLIGDRVVIEARRFSNQTSISRTGRHRAYRITANHGVTCVIEAPLRNKAKE